jgi:FdhD protein
MDLFIKRRILKIHGNLSDETDDSLAVEKKLRISVNNNEIISCNCSPAMIRELITGLFFTHGLIQEKTVLSGMDIQYGDEITAHIHTTENFTAEHAFLRCLGGFTLGEKANPVKFADDFSVPVRSILSMNSELQKRAELFRMTGCFHSAALSDGRDILVFAEDIGRHNAVDKVIGFAILNDMPFADKVLFVSCRVSSEIVSKCAACGIPVLASRAAPTDLAVEIADSIGMTLAGFMRGEHFNIYAHPKRIIR